MSPIYIWRYCIGGHILRSTPLEGATVSREVCPVDKFAVMLMRSRLR
jgi:hypothetical protein